MTVHHHDSSSEASGAAAWMMAMVFTVVLAVALIVALFVWAPWDDNTTIDRDGGAGGDSVPQETAPSQPNEPAPSP